MFWLTTLSLVPFFNGTCLTSFLSSELKIQNLLQPRIGIHLGIENPDSVVFLTPPAPVAFIVLGVGDAFVIYALAGCCCLRPDRPDTVPHTGPLTRRLHLSSYFRRLAFCCSYHRPLRVSPDVSWPDGIHGHRPHQACRSQRECQCRASLDPLLRPRRSLVRLDDVPDHFRAVPCR